MSAKACTTCTFFDKVSKSAENAGLCRFNAPSFLTEAELDAKWPVVKSTDWCGRFDAKA